jgi:hypothetical protein
MLILASAVAWADDISQEEAQQIAAQAMASFSAHQTKSPRAGKGVPVSQPKAVLAYTARAAKAEQNDYYVFNNAEEDGGFVIVSGSDATDSPVLGYCDHGSFDYDEAPCCLKDLLEQYESQIDFLRAHPQAAKVRKNESFIISYGKDVVAPFLKTQWNQHTPFNNFCPIMDGQEMRSVTGCVATAIAQIMAYWKYPKEGRGSCYYSWNPTATSPSFKYGGNLTGHVYDWDNMLDSYEGSYTEAQANAVARLLNDVGISMKMVYNSTNSNPHGDIAWSLTKFFGYDPDSIRTIVRDIDTLYVKPDAEFDNLLKKELDAGRPVYLGTAVGKSIGTTHAVVLDGYTDEDYFHLNFGWSGKYDGYYKTLLIDIDADFPFQRQMLRYIKQKAIVGICPAHSVKQGDTYYCLRDNEATLTCALNKSEITVPASVTDEKGNSYPVTAVTSAAFFENDSMVSVSLPASLQTIGDQAFMNCTGLKNINIPGGVKSVPEYAFQNCTSLEDGVTLEEGVERIGNGAFCYCSKLKEITLPVTLTNICDSAFTFDAALEIVKGDYVTRVGKYAFLGCKKLENFFVGRLRYIGEHAFSGCKLVSGYLINAQIIGDQAFWDNPIKSLEFQALEFLGDQVFNHAIPSNNTVTSFRLGAKAPVQSLHGLPPSLTQIVIDDGNPRFTAINNIIYSKDMTSLVYASSKYYYGPAHGYINRTKLVIPEGVTRIERKAVHTEEGWNASTPLKELTIPSTVSTIDTLAFAECYSLQKIYNHAMEPQPLKGRIFGAMTPVVYVPEGCHDAYAAAEVWKEMQIYEDLPIPDYDDEDDYAIDDEETRVNGVRINNYSGNDAYTYEVLFDSKPELTYEKEQSWNGMTVNNILLTANCELVMVMRYMHYPQEQPASLSVGNLKNLEFFYDEEADGIETVPAEGSSSTVRFRVTGRTIDVSGLKAGEEVVLYALDGTIVASAKSHAEGRTSITVPEGSAMTYVLKAGEASFKIKTK